MEPLSFPLYQGFFPQLVLSVDELLAYRRMGKERVSQLVRIVEDADCVYNWSDVKVSNPNSSSSGSSSSANAMVKCQRAQFIDVRPDSKATQASTFLKASVHIVDVQPEEILSVLAKNKTKDLRKTMAYMHGDGFVDAQTLLMFPTSANSKKPSYSYRAIKWCALKSKQQARRAGNAEPKKTKAVLDFCFLEYAGRKKAHPSSTVLGFIVQESLSQEREVPQLDSYGITRAQLSRTGIVISRTHQSNILKVTSICQIDGALSAAVRSAMEDIMLENVAAIHRVKGLLERQRMGKLQYLEEWEWVANADRKACAVCLRGFYFHRKHHCQTCGEVVCSSCAPLRELDEPLFDSTQIRVCTVCLASAGSQATSTERTSSNGGTEAYIRDLQSHPKQQYQQQQRTRERDSSSYSPVAGPHIRHTRPSRLSEESRPSRLSEDVASLTEYRPRRSSFAGSIRAPAPATTEALSKLAYHMQQIRETINVAISEVDQSNSQSCDDVYEKILQIRETLDISGSEFDAVLASIGGGAGSRSDDGDAFSTEYNSSSNSEMDHESLYYSEDQRSSLYSRSSLSQSSLGSSSSSMSMSHRSARSAAARALAPVDAEPEQYGNYSNRNSHSNSHDRRSPMHKDSLFSDQTVASSASKQSSEGKQRPNVMPAKALHHHQHYQHEPQPEQVLTVNNARGIHRLARKIEKLQQRLEDSHRAASSVASVSDLESEPEPDHVLYNIRDSRGRRSSYVESKPAAATAPAAPGTPRSSPSEKARITSEMVQALRGVMESSELTKPPPAWRKSFSSSNNSSHNEPAVSSGNSGSSSVHARSRHSGAGGGGAPPLAPSRQVPVASSISSDASSSTRSAKSSSSSKFTPVPGSTIFVYDHESNAHTLQRLSIPFKNNSNIEKSEDERDDDEFSISSSEDGLAVSMGESGGREEDARRGHRQYAYPPLSSAASDDSLDSLEDGEEHEDIASLPQYAMQNSSMSLKKPFYYDQRDENESADEVRRLIEDVGKLPARMRTSSGQSSGAPSQENYDF